MCNIQTLHFQLENLIHSFFTRIRLDEINHIFMDEEVNAPVKYLDDNVP